MIGILGCHTGNDGKDISKNDNDREVCHDTALAEFFFDTAMILNENSNYKLSAKYFECAISSNCKRYAYAYYMMGNNHLILEDYLKAEFAFSEAIKWGKSDDNYWKYYHNRALSRKYLCLDTSKIYSDADSAILFGDTSMNRDLSPRRR